MLTVEHNCFYLCSMSVKENLTFFARLKGHLSTEELKNDVNYMMDRLDLTYCKNTKAADLSGGQRRRLSVGIAFIGNSKVGEHFGKFHNFDNCFKWCCRKIQTNKSLSYLRIKVNFCFARYFLTALAVNFWKPFFRNRPVLFREHLNNNAQIF